MPLEHVHLADMAGSVSPRQGHLHLQTRCGRGEQLETKRAAGRESNPLSGLYYKLPILHAIRPKSGEFLRVRCDSLEGGLSLWEEYFAEARVHVNALGGRAFELKYESLLAEPEEVLKAVARFCRLPVSDAAIEGVAALVQRERAYAYREKPELQAFADRVAGRLHGYGY